jgi:hypothetical protein
MKNQKNKQKIIHTTLLILLTTTILPTTLIFASPTINPTTTATLTGSTTITLTATDIAAMPTYTGVGCPRRSGGVYPLEMLGNYTGVPLLYLCNLVGGLGSDSLVTVTASDGYSATLSYEQVHDNVFPQFNISTHQAISGQNPLLMLAYGVNGTTLTSDGTDTDTDLGGPLRLIVVSNNGTSTDMACDGMATFGNSYVKFVSVIEITNPGSLTFKTCNSSDAAKTIFDSGESIYFSATGLSASTEYPIYVVPDATDWAVRVPFSPRVAGSEPSISTDSSGTVTAHNIYANAQAGQYAVIVDINSNGEYDEADLFLNKIVVNEPAPTTSPSPSLSPSPSPSTSPTPNETLTPTPYTTPSPSPTIPEFSSLLVIVVLLMATSVMVIIGVKKKQLIS